MEGFSKIDAHPKQTSIRYGLRLLIVQEIIRLTDFALELKKDKGDSDP